MKLICLKLDVVDFNDLFKFGLQIEYNVPNSVPNNVGRNVGKKESRK